MIQTSKAIFYFYDYVTEPNMKNKKQGGVRGAEKKCLYLRHQTGGQLKRGLLCHRQEVSKTAPGAPDHDVGNDDG